MTRGAVSPVGEEQVVPFPRHSISGPAKRYSSVSLDRVKHLAHQAMILEFKLVCIGWPNEPAVLNSIDQRRNTQLTVPGVIARFRIIRRHFLRPTTTRTDASRACARLA